MHMRSTLFFPLSLVVLLIALGGSNSLSARSDGKAVEKEARNAPEEKTDTAETEIYPGIAVYGGFGSFSSATPFPEGVTVSSAGYCVGAEFTFGNAELKTRGGLLLLVSRFGTEDYLYTSTDISGNEVTTPIPLTDYTLFFLGLNFKFRSAGISRPLAPFFRFGFGLGGGFGAEPSNPGETRITLERNPGDVLPLGLLPGVGLELLAGRNHAFTFQLAAPMSFSLNRMNNSGWRTFGLDVTLGYELRDSE